MTTANPTKEEEFVTEVAKYLVERGTPAIAAKELKTIAKELGYEDVEGMTNYIRSTEGADFFRKSLRLELWKVGYRPRGWEL